jgi:cholera toxin transcriptional activator
MKNDCHSSSDCNGSTSGELYFAGKCWIQFRIGYTRQEIMTDPRPARRYRFGAFEADGATGELRRQGLRIKLNAQPFQVLFMLLERPGELLTREEISRELWPEGTFVDYEHGVNSAVNRIREALGDTASSPRFVETLARRGYRFVAPVERIGLTENPSRPSAPESESAPPISLEKSALPAEAETKPRSRILATPQDLPKTSYAVVQTIFVLFQAMYLGFYVGALANLAEIEDLFSPLPNANLVFNVLIVTAAILIPVRAFVLCAVLFHAPGVREKFLRIWPFLLFLDVLWSLSPFLLLHHINFGLALACTALLVYSPFAQRSLILMGAGGVDHSGIRREAR